ncbi:D-alanyl-D-alanine dipeptidase [Caldanaerobacter subterraneus subsp. tengcongensis MB4]|nr:MULTISPECIES: M15 family metallopeptidase [Caldanaerobacter]MCS3917463.1 D-alanyl-D-alanine dipeptidase [Caldanaerobacter subterraneus subsp. tengcongensis MB4]
MKELVGEEYYKIAGEKGEKMSDKNFKEIPISTPIEKWNWEEVRKIPIRENNEKLVPLSLYPERIIVRSEYFLQGIKGALPECYVRESVYEKLLEAADLLPPGYKFVIFDTWRPIQVQQSLFDTLKEQFRKQYPSESEEEITKRTLTFVALPSTDPTRPSPHNTGGAVDLTIADDKGRLLNMGTEYDDPTEKARTTYFEELLKEGKELSKEEREALENRRLLFNIMTSVGFTNYLDEWWHYDYGNQNWAWVSKKEYALYGRAKPFFAWRSDIE